MIIYYSSINTVTSGGGGAVSGGGGAVSGGGGAGPLSRSRQRRLASRRGGKRICGGPWTRPYSPQQSARVLLFVATFQQRQIAARSHGPRYGFLSFQCFCTHTRNTCANTDLPCRRLIVYHRKSLVCNNMKILKFWELKF